MAQPSSGTTAFAPTFGQILVESYSRIQVRPPSLTAQHMVDGVQSANYLQAEWTSEEGPNLFKIQLLSISLVQGQASYSIPENVTDIFDWYLRLPPLTNQLPIDIVVTPISRTEYADQPNKTLQARPTTVWWDRLINSTVTMWPVPDANGPYVLYYYAEIQIDDVALPQGATLNIPYRFYDAFAAGLAAKLAVKYSPPAMVQQSKMLADEAWKKASDKDIERVPIYIIPGLDFYSRNS